MRIGELARRSGLSASRIRFYEGIGLLHGVERSLNGYRSYPAEAAMILELIAAGQRAGFSLEEIRTLLPPDGQHWDHDTLMTTLRRKVAEIEAMQARLTQNRAELLDLIARIEARPHDIDCAANTRRVLDGLLDRANSQ